MQITNAFPIEDINHQLQLILGSAAFKNSPTLTKFLTFIISETLLEREQQLKEYNIAINVLSRSRDFNPQDDAVVRIHAGRLRRALNEYYLIQGINDPIIIHIPKGGYIPQFQAGTPGKPIEIVPSAAPEQFINPIVAVFPFRTMSQKQNIKTFSLILSEQLSAELSRFRDITVIGYYSSETLAKIEQNVMESGKSVGADYIITGSIQYCDHHLRILVNLSTVATGEVIMAKFFEKKGILSGMFEMQDEIIQTVIGAVGGYDGIISREMGKAHPGQISNNSSIRDTLSVYSEYKRSYTLDNYNAALSKVQLVVTENPNHAILWAILAELHLDGMGLGINDSNDPLALAYQYVSRSYKIDPHCQHACYALTLIHLLKKEKEACLNAARQCIQLNPNNSSMVAGAAFILICSGYFEEGFSNMEKAITSDSYEPVWICAGTSFYYLYKKDYTSALLWAERMKSEETFWDPLLKCVSLSYLNKKEEAQRYLVKLLKMEPKRSTKIRARLSTLLLSDELMKRILGGLEKLGFEEGTSIPARLNA